MKPRICQHAGCGIEFAPTGKNQIYCAKCGVLVAKEQRKKSSKKWRETTGKQAQAKKCIQYRKSQSAIGYIQRTYVVHIDDADKLREFAKKLRRDRKTKPE